MSHAILAGDFDTRLMQRGLFLVYRTYPSASDFSQKANYDTPKLCGEILALPAMTTGLRDLDG